MANDSDSLATDLLSAVDPVFGVLTKVQELFSKQAAQVVSVKWWKNSDASSSGVTM